MYLAPYGVGLGHASRLVMVADMLKDSGIEVQFSSFGEAASYVAMHGYKCNAVAPVEFAWNPAGGFSVKDSLAHIPRWFANFWRQVNQEIRFMSQSVPDIVLSDSRLSPIVAARILKIPSIVILNQIKLLLSPRLRDFAISRFFEDIIGEFLGSLWNLADRILVPDLPPPNTISAHNIQGTASAGHSLEYVGFAAPIIHTSRESIEKVTESLGLDYKRPVVFVHVSGPSQTRMPLVDIGLRAAAILEDKVQFIISEGRPGGKVQPVKCGKSCWYYEWCPVRDEIFSLCDVAVLRGGHVTLSQAIHFGRPVITVPIDNHGEQLGNSSKVAEMGVAKMLSPKKLSAEELAGAIGEILADRRYAEKALQLKLIAEKMNGIENVANVVRSYI